ncbi:TetR/AcrR family transcriptional regulator [Microbacterium sp.]|jgi:AcrR family transcriptional regulator|uniref:TetR/AcrR family transcriptional regulator n=1 Tax=Microbacterium sp. TaxID=51671 RepID=UPI0037C68EE7
MRSASDAGDLTMRARIRDAAVEIFAESGFDRATVRAIAARAGASPALVLHHFGSKAALRRACDEHVVSSLLADRTAAAEPGTGMAAVFAKLQDDRPRLDYLARLLAEPGDLGAKTFDALLAHTRAFIRDIAEKDPSRFSDPDATALLLTAYGLAPLVLQSHLARNLGADPLSPEGAGRLAVPGLELLTHGVYPDDSLLTAAKAALAGGEE